MKNIISKYKHAWVFLYSFIYLSWFYALEKRNVVSIANVHIRLDDYIPFNEWFVIPYLLWFAYIGAVIFYFFFYSKEDFYKVCAFLFTGMTICLIIYTIWPNGQNMRPTTFTRSNVFIDIVKRLYLTDTCTNVCPSIHVYNSIGAHIAISNSHRLKKRKWLRAGSFILMVSICLSTVFLKQHSVFDGFCSMGLSLVLYFAVYKIDYNKLFNRSKESVATVQET